MLRFDPNGFHPQVHFHFTPTHASWLNQIDIWFSILSRQALQGANFTSVAQLRHAIDEFIKHYNSDAVLPSNGLNRRSIKWESLNI